ncbi:hypothetical protein GCM10027517_30140 [Phycicoccus ginsengisoli]
MNERWQPAQAMRGLLLVRAEVPAVTRWVRGGLVACQLVPLASWTAVAPVEPSSRAHAPYDGAASVLLGRPVPRRLRPALGFVVADQRAAVVVRGRGLLDRPRWLLWQPGRGPVRTRELAPARPGELAAAAGRPDAARRVADVVRDRSGDAERLLTDLLAVLDLPGADLLGPHVGLRGQVVAPTAQAVARFDTRMAEIARHHRELEDS